MTIRISTAAALIQTPHINISERYSITTVRAVSITDEGENLNFELKFFYDMLSNENTIPRDIYEDESIRFTGNLSAVTNDVIHVNVQQAHSLGTSRKLPRHCIEVNVNGRVSSSPTDVATTVGTHVDDINVSDTDLNLTESSEVSFTMFRVTSTQWSSFPKKDGTAGSTGKNVPFEFIVRHETRNRLASRTKRLTLNQNINVLGLLELVNSKLYVQLTDIAWISHAGTQRSNSSSSPQSASQSSASNPDSNSPSLRISASRALAAQLDTIQTKATSTGETRHKRGRTTETTTLPTPTSTRKTSTASTDASQPVRKEVDIESLSSSEESPALQPPKRRNLRSSVRRDTTEAGNSNLLPRLPSVNMVGGIPQLNNIPKTRFPLRVATLRKHATSVLPIREFSLI